MTRFAPPRPVQVDAQQLQASRNIVQQGVYDDRYRKLDGAYMGANQKFYNGSSVNLSSVPAVKPTNRPHNGAEVIYVNGIDTDPKLADSNMQQFANKTGAAVRGVYNATFGIGTDVLQAGRDLFGAQNKATAQLTQTIYHTIKKQGAAGNMHLFLESQGAIIGSNALTAVRNRLLDEYGYKRFHNPFDGDQRKRNENALKTVDAMMGKIKVETYGGATPEYPDGPKYIHFVRTKDPVAFNLGMASLGRTHPGRDAVIVQLPNLGGGPINEHVVRNYVPHRPDNIFGAFYENNKGKTLQLR